MERTVEYDTYLAVDMLGLLDAITEDRSSGRGDFVVVGAEGDLGPGAIGARVCTVRFEGRRDETLSIGGALTLREGFAPGGARHSSTWVHIDVADRSSRVSAQAAEAILRYRVDRWLERLARSHDALTLVGAAGSRPADMAATA